MNLAIEIQEAIARNLPAELGASLKKRLEKAEADEKSVDRLTAANEAQKKQIEDLSKKVKSDDEATKRDAGLKEREDILREDRRELDHRLEIASIRQQCAENGQQQLREIVSLVFCSPVSRRVLNENSNEPVISTQNGYANTVGTKSSSRTVEETATGPGLQA